MVKNQSKKRNIKVQQLATKIKVEKSSKNTGSAEAVAVRKANHPKSTSDVKKSNKPVDKVPVTKVSANSHATTIKITPVVNKSEKLKADNVKMAEVSQATRVTTTSSSKTATQVKKIRAQRGTHTMPAVLRVLLSIMLLIAVAVALTWYIILQQNLGDAETAVEFITKKPTLFVYSCVVIFGLLAVLTAVTWRVFFSTGLMFCIVSVIMFINTQKFQLRAAPLLPEEFMLAGETGNLIQFVEVSEIYRMVFGVLFTMIGAILLEYYVRKVWGRDPRKLPRWQRWSIIPRITFSLVSITLLVCMVNPVMRRERPEWLKGFKMIAWSQTENYEENGFVIGFLYNLGKLEMSKPEDYSEEKIAEIAAKYQQQKSQDTERVNVSEVAENVVFIMNESFYDPALLTKYYAHGGGDVTPNLHALFRKYPSGYMYSPEYGGNTANVEFEGQTGLTNYWASTFPYVNIIPKRNSVISLANWTKDFGFDATAVHAYDGNMYKRHLTYPKLGLEDFRDESKMTYTDKDYSSTVINDQSVYNEVYDILKESDAPKTVVAVTMQNHAPYTQAEYPQHSFPLREQGDNWWSIESNFESLYYADKYLGEFIEKLDELDEKTVVVWFGDHAMGQLDAYIKSEDKHERDLAHLTPYFIYANFEIESPYTVRETAALNAELGFDFSKVAGVNLPTTTPNCLTNTMYNILGVEKPAMGYLLDEVCSEVPVLALAYWDGSEPTASEALREYELVNYDILSGKAYWDGK